MSLVAVEQRRPAVDRPSAGTGALVLIGFVLVAFNLRTAITGLGALLDDVTTGLRLSGAVAGVVTTLPAVAFAVFGGLTPWLNRRFPAARVLVAAMAVLAAGQIARVLTDSPAVFVATTAIALAGIAVANVLLPVLVRQHFPRRTGLITGVYTMSLILGASAGAAASVPIANAFGSWRAGLGAWALLAIIGALPWLPAALRRTAGASRPVTPAHARVRAGRTRLGWAMAVFFGTQALSGYATMGWLAQMFRDSGYSATTAGLLLAGVTAFAVPIALLMPALAGRPVRPRAGDDQLRHRDLRPFVLVLTLAMIGSYVGLALAPYDGAVLWVLLLAIGQSTFPLALAMIGMRARTADGAVALSAFAQSVGYLIAALGPLVVGILYDATGGWSLPIGFLIGAAVVQAIAGVSAGSPRMIEDEA